MKAMFKFLSMELGLLLSVNCIFAMQQPMRVGLPSSFNWVPFNSPCSTIGFINLLSPIKIGRSELYAISALRMRGRWKQRPFSLAQVALADAGYEGIDVAFKSMGGQLLRAPYPIQQIAVDGSRLAAYALVQKTARRFFPTLADQQYDINMRVGKRDAGERIAAAFLVLGAMIVAKKSGLSNLLFKGVSKLFMGGANKLFDKEVVAVLRSPEFAFLGEILCSFVGYSVANSIIHKNIVGPSFERFFGMHPRRQWEQWTQITD